jgi:hypothetical protein
VAQPVQFPEKEETTTGAKKVLNLRLHNESNPRKIPAASVKQENGHLLAFNGNELVADIPQDRIECWSLDLE